MRNQHKRKNYDTKLITQRTFKKRVEQAKNENERQRFDAEMNNIPRIGEGLSRVDISTKKWETWSLHISFPFIVRKDDPRHKRFLKIIRENIKNAWKTCFNS